MSVSLYDSVGGEVAIIERVLCQWQVLMDFVLHPSLVVRNLHYIGNDVQRTVVARTEEYVVQRQLALVDDFSVLGRAVFFLEKFGYPAPG